MTLTNKMVVITGGSGKTGKAIAERLAQSGVSIVIADAHLINAEITVQYLKEKYKTAATAVGPNKIEIKSITGDEGIDIWINAGPHFFEVHLKEVKGMIIDIIPESQITKFKTLQNNSHGSHFRVSHNINSMCVSAHGWVDGTEFWQKVLALVLDIVSDTIL